MAYQIGKIDDRSSVGISESMNLFDMPSVDIGTSKVRYVEYKPLNQLNQDVGLEFEIPNTGNRYIDLRRTYLTTKVRVKGFDGKFLPSLQVTGESNTSLANVSPVNNFMHSLYSQVDIYLQKKLITTSNSNYPYEAYFNTLLKYDETAKKTHLESQLYIKDEGLMDAKDIGGGNPGMTLRARYIAESNTVDMMGPILSDVCYMNRYLLNGIELKIRLWPTKQRHVSISCQVAQHLITRLN